MTNNTIADTAASAPEELGELRHIAPAELVLDDNVRTDAADTITPEFIRSIGEGVHTPLLAYEDGEGAIVVWDGQRRLLAALEAGNASVPVYVTTRAAADEQGRTVERIAGQVITADQRAALTQSQRVVAMQQLHLAGLSATKIAKTLHTDKRKVVDHALKAAASPSALTALDDHALTLEQAAVLAEYEDDPDATDRLLNAARRGQFDYAAKHLADTAAERAAVRVAIEQHNVDGIATVTQRPSFNDDAVSLTRLLDSDGERLSTIDQVPAAHRVAYVFAVPTETWTDAEGNPVDETLIDWSLEDSDDETATPEDGEFDPRQLTRLETIEVETAWYVRDYAAAGFTLPNYDTPRSLHGEDEPTEADKQAQRDERRQTIALNKKAVAATEVRREKLGEFLARKTLPKGKATVVAEFLATTMWHSHDLFGYNRQDGNAKSLTMGFLGDKTPAEAGDGATAERRQIINLAIAVGAHEADMPKSAWRETDRSYTAHRVTYLRMLVDVFGHTLTDVEQIIVGDLDPDSVDLDS